MSRPGYLLVKDCTERNLQDFQINLGLTESIAGLSIVMENPDIFKEKNMCTYLKRPIYLFTLYSLYQKYSRLRCLLRFKGLVIGFYLGWSGHTFLIRKI